VDQWLTDLVSHFGYWIIFFGVGMESMGIPLPGETALGVGAVFAAQGHLSPIGVFFVGWAAAVLGDNTGYLIGRRWGHRFMQLRGVRSLYSPQRVARAESFFERHGWHAVFFGRFIALLRIFAGPLAGMHGMRWRNFFLANAAGGALWVASITGLGLLIGNNLHLLLRIVTTAGFAGLFLVIFAVISYVVWYRRRKSLN
jgi:membrane protein DedA with SNARE-associated domain